MISELLELLKNDPRIYGWNVKTIEKDSYQLFFIKQNLDMNRESLSNDCIVTIFTFQSKDGISKMGQSRFHLYSSMSEQEIKDKIEEQISICDYTLNVPFKLPRKANVRQLAKETGITLSDKSLKENAFIVADAVFEADKYVSGYLNSTEIFISKTETKFYDSNGNIFSHIAYKGEMELVATWSENENEVEQYKYVVFDEIDTKQLQEEANKLLLQASERVKAVKTPEIQNCKVLLSNQYVKDYFWHFANKTNADALYLHKSSYNIGSHIQYSTKCDALDIHLEPIMKKSTEGAMFDDEGIVLKRLHVIENGIIKNFWGSNAKSQYANLPVHGEYKNIHAAAGTLKAEDLAAENYVEIISVSDFEIDIVTGNFSSEIRLAYIHMKGKPAVAITGGSFTGNVSASLNTVRFAEELVQQNDYYGPKYVLLDNVSFTKGE